MDLATQDEKEIENIFKKENRAMVEQDLTALKEIIAPEAILTHITGAEQSRDEWLKQIKIGRMRYKKSVLKRIVIQLIDDDHASAVVQNLVTARIYGFTNDWMLQSANQLIKREGKWIITSSKASLA
ncbi:MULTISPECIES: nuclear transport factor 2 family protein [Lactobacillus]|uniref:nuclear transport factor 2 family protein n=1 Tax=Lactobacillus TaxID=1578 RepID=UPI000EE32ECE|nr:MULTISPECIES: nuclear transport factor 2 family protein [Lactobacillus]MRM98517.1 nuclear transport factor 2 family protein [Lactobacillus taiwanensis]